MEADVDTKAGARADHGLRNSHLKPKEYCEKQNRNCVGIPELFQEIFPVSRVPRVSITNSTVLCELEVLFRIKLEPTWTT